MDRDFARNLENIKTKLFSVSSANHFTYNRVNWKLHIRKEVREKEILMTEILNNCLVK